MKKNVRCCRLLDSLSLTKELVWPLEFIGHIIGVQTELISVVFPLCSLYLKLERKNNMITQSIASSNIPLVKKCRFREVMFQSRFIWRTVKKEGRRRPASGSGADSQTDQLGWS